MKIMKTEMEIKKMKIMKTKMEIKKNENYENKNGN